MHDLNDVSLLSAVQESGFLHKVVLFDRGPWVIEEIQVFAQPQTVQSMVLSTSKVHNSLTDQQTKYPVHTQMFLTQKIKRSNVNLRELLGSTRLHAGAGRDVDDCQICSRLTVSLLLQGVLYVGTSEGVTAVPVANCSTYTTCSQCLLARDPLCGWSRTSRACARVHGGHEDM